MKPKTELCSILDRNMKLVWIQDAYLSTDGTLHRVIKCTE
jgi:hypothetical protein